MALAEKTSAIHFDEHTISEFSKIFQTRDNVRGRLAGIDPKTKEPIPTSETDGGLFFRPAVFKDIVRVMGFDSKTQDNIKPVVMGRLTSPVDKGLVFIKSGGKNAAGQEAINKLIKDNNLDFVVFDSANKITGETRPTTFRYENGEYILEGMPEVNKVGIKSLRINPSTYEDVPGGIKGINLPRQFFITANEHQSPNTLRSFIDHYYTNLEGTTKARGLVEEFKQTGDIKPIQEYLEASRSNIDKMPLSFVIKQLGKNTEDGNVFRRALQKIDAESDKLIESFEYDTNKKYSFYHDTTANLSRLAGGKYAPNTFFEKLRGDYFNSIRKYTVKRVTTPFWPYGGKGWLNPVTKDVFADADMINNRPVKQGEVLLDAAHQKMPIKINLEPAQIAALNKFKRGINKDGETTLGHLWTLWKINNGKLGTPEQVNNFKALPKETIKKLDEALDLLLIRIPADSLSGVRAVKFKGFTKHKGAGITTHRTEDKYLGGADKDADSAFIIQNGDSIVKTIDDKDVYPFNALTEKDSLKFPQIIELELIVQELKDLTFRSNYFFAAYDDAAYSNWDTIYTSIKGKDINVKPSDFYSPVLIQGDRMINQRWLANKIQVDDSTEIYQHPSYVENSFYHKWNLRDYPFDTQQLKISFRTFDDTSRVLIKDIDNIKIGKSRMVQDTDLIDGWDFKDITTEESFLPDPALGYRVKTIDGERIPIVQNFSYLINIQRDGWFLYFKLFFGTFLSFIISYLVFFIDKKYFETRITLSIGGIFGAVGNRYFVESLMPEVQVLTKADLVNNLIISLIVINIFMVIMQQNNMLKNNKFISSNQKLAVFSAILFILLNLIIIYL